MSQPDDDRFSSPCKDDSYYAGELVPNPVQRWTREQQIALLDSHPMFTGRCSNCEQPMLQTHPARGHWNCEHCGWRDDSV
ncbi:MAG: hypothetical protein KME10_28255 [Plectolyngbya sp. WJT66-NPBG17]|nr:hypothetical protein [Plectolyngbya sp. WJT66-NPBG17]